ncbi:ATP-dependent caseinolytic protease/crotonase family protein isoform 2 [Hibiscus syriacus]|uniref:3-hydroxyisobutyryl-CoA hydrolase n=1 Tax=Hibiscus syriacus TaxID=106335 RepID=A0A6A3D5H6_HIBSY|nr:ATP-dependent caseinolytic protease/crotonase family protein isoform 2 [Hibiscus syriacus]
MSLKRLVTSLRRDSLFRFKRNLSPLPINSSVGDLQNEVLVEGRATSRIAILHRPSSLNALNTNVVKFLIAFQLRFGTSCARLHELYASWENDPNIGFVVMKGSGRAFCAGGDIVALYHLINEGKIEECKELFRTAYSFIYHVGTYLKPHLAILNGITMGGGAGISIPGTFRLATGEKLSGAEMISCGVATQLSHTEKLPLIEEELGNLDEVLYKCFGHDTVEEIIDAMESEASATNDPWCNSTLKKLTQASPLSLKIREGRFQTFDQCWIREYRMSCQGISKQISNDFCEVRAQVVDKDFAPKWESSSLEKVSNDMVDQYFAPLSESEPNLELPTKQREAFN